MLLLWGSVFVPCFAVQWFVSSLVCHHLDPEERPGCFTLFDFLVRVLWLLLFCGSSSWCHGLVCSVWMWYFLIIFTYFYEKLPANYLLWEINITVCNHIRLFLWNPDSVFFECYGRHWCIPTSLGFVISQLAVSVASYLIGCFTPQLTNFQSCWDNFLSSWVEPVLSSGYIKRLAQVHNTVTQLMTSLELSPVLRSTNWAYDLPSQSK